MFTNRNKKMNFISIYKNAMTDKDCDEIINQFEKNPQYQKKGVSGLNQYPFAGVQPDKKKSTDITYNINKNAVTSEIIKKSLDKHVCNYIKEYPDINKQLANWACVPEYNVQKYKPNEGYFAPHCENCDKHSSNWVLAWMYYLNNVPDGGTLFPTLDVKLEAIKGTLALWPAYWTHVHMGQISKTHTKYIVTGWYAYV